MARGGCESTPRAVEALGNRPNCPAASDSPPMQRPTSQLSGSIATPRGGGREQQPAWLCLWVHPSHHRSLGVSSRCPHRGITSLFLHPVCCRGTRVGVWDTSHGMTRKPPGQCMSRRRAVSAAAANARHARKPQQRRGVRCDVHGECHRRVLRQIALRPQVAHAHGGRGGNAEVLPPRGDGMWRRACMHSSP
jgi:hypothetical protein